MVILANKNNEIDSAYHTLVKHIETDKTIVMVSWAENFQFNEQLLSIKDYILVCYCEYGYDHDFGKTGTHIWGCNSVKFPRYYKGDWIKFDDWVKKTPPSLIFKREFIKDDFTINYSHNLVTIKPIDYTTNLDPIPLQSEEDFNSRPITACYYFGRSHEGRLKTHASIWEGATKYGYSVCDNMYYFNGFMNFQEGRKYVSMYIPHYQRHPIETVLSINGMAKIGFAPMGAGQKTFRAAEVSCNSVMLMWNDNLAWGYDWVNGVNCFKCNPGEEVELIETLINSMGILYDVYKKGVENWNKYRTTNYISNYINPIIKNNGWTE